MENDLVGSHPLLNAETLAKLEEQYLPIPSFRDWAAGLSIDAADWEHRLQRVEAAAQQATPEALDATIEVAVRAAAVDTGAIEDLYSTTTQLTLAIATQAAGWEDQARANEETFFDFFTAQLNAYAAARDVAVGDAPITEAWIRTLHEIVTASQAT